MRELINYEIVYNFAKKYNITVYINLVGSKVVRHVIYATEAKKLKTILKQFDIEITYTTSGYMYFINSIKIHNEELFFLWLMHI